MPSIRWGSGAGADVCLPFSGNATLSGCRVVGAGGADDDIALAWNEAAVDANTVGLWRMNEAAWNGTAGEVVDASGNGYHGQAYNGANTVDGCLDRAGSFNRAGSQSVVVPHNAGLNLVGDMTLEFWWYRSAAYSSAWETVICKRNDNFTRYTPFVFNFSSGVTQWIFGDTVGQRVCAYAGNLPLNEWCHVAGTRASGHMRMWLNGVQVAYADLSAYTPRTTTRPVEICKYNVYEYCTAMLDDIRISDAARYSDTFSPARYKSAAQNSGTQPYTQASYAGLIGMVPSAVSWSATTGAAYGQVKRVWVNGSAGWVQVGGDYPTSPVAVSGLVLPSADAVRVELEPEQVSGIQSETPVLDWVQLEYVPPSGGRVYRPTPFRLGPKLLPIGVLA